MSNRSAKIGVEQAYSRYRHSDHKLFSQGYSKITEEGLENKKVLEVCCGKGDLSGWIAGLCPKVDVIGIDWSEEDINDAKQKYLELSNLHFMVGDVFNLENIPTGTIDIVVGQAALHHLQNNLQGISKEIFRILKPRGRCIFIFEPIGHNPIISAIRAALNSRTKLIDEADLYENAIQIFACNFNRYEVYYFSLFSYACKLLPNSSISKTISNLIFYLDNLIYKFIPSSRKYSANANICFWK